MNTGSAIETERLFLLPSRTDRDSEAFLQMLRDDGDFYIFCGVSPSEKHVMGFANYFERTDHELCTYSIFPKQQKDKFIGYVGVHREMEDEYEIEFYIAREYRRNGYCEEASRELINQLFGDGVSANGKNPEESLWDEPVYLQRLCPAQRKVCLPFVPFEKPVLLTWQMLSQYRHW